jgi:hypothetical protein
VDLERGDDFDITMLDACAPSTAAPTIAPFIVDVGPASGHGDATYNGGGGGLMLRTSSQFDNSSECGGETPGSCVANNMQQWDTATTCTSTPAHMSWKGPHANGGLVPMQNTQPGDVNGELAKLPRACVELLMRQPWVLEKVLPMLSGEEWQRELGWQVLDALGASFFPRLQGRDLEASEGPVVAYITIRCLVNACTGACSHVSGIASMSFTLVKDNCWSRVQGGSGRARTTTNKVKKARQDVAMQGLATTAVVMQKVLEAVHRQVQVEKVVVAAQKQLQVVADHMWDPAVTSLHAEGALRRLQAMANTM